MSRKSLRRGCSGQLPSSEPKPGTAHVPVHRSTKTVVHLHTEDTPQQQEETEEGSGTPDGLGGSQLRVKSDTTAAHSEPAPRGGMRAPSTPAGRGGAPGHHGTGGRGRTDHPGIPVDVHTHSCSLSKLLPNLTVTQSNTAMVHN